MVDEDKYVISASITDVEKRRLPTKHYVYIISVVWSNGKQQVICRRYSHFFTLQTSLIDEYPKEAGVLDPTERILPFLPGKIIFGRSNTREVALKRRDLINEYLVKLIKLPENISRSCLVINFMESNEDDIKGLLDESSKRTKAPKTADNISDPVLLEQYIVIANFKKTERNQVSLAAGDTVEVIEKHENGWWFVNLDDEQGWVPSSYLEPIDGKHTETAEVIIQKSGEEEKYICKRAFMGNHDDEISIEIGDIVEVLEKHPDGWWKIRTSVKASKTEGFVPVANLKRVPKSTEAKLPRRPVASPKVKQRAPPRQGTIKRKIDKPPPISSGKDKTPPAIPPAKQEEEVIYVALSDFKTEMSQGNLRFTEGAEISILEKDPNGWWYVRVDGEEGWIPSTVAQRTRRPKDMKKQLRKENPMKVTYITIGAYDTTVDTEISFSINQQCEVLEKDPCGWWFVRISGKEGWAPSTFLQKSEPEPEKKRIVNGVKDILEAIPLSVDKKTPVPRKRSDASSANAKQREPQRPSKPKIPTKPAVAAKPNFQSVGETVPKPVKRNQSNNRSTSSSSGGEITPPSRPKQPSTSRPAPPKPPPVSSNMYVALEDYHDNDDGMLNLKKGQQVTVMEKDEGGWWLAQAGAQTGWVPSNFLQKM